MTDPAAESEQFTTSCVTVTAFHFVGVETGRSLRVNFNKTNQPILTIEGKEQGLGDDPDGGYALWSHPNMCSAVA